MVYQRADREIRLRAEIEALRRIEAAQLKRIEEAEAEAQTRQRAATAALELAEEEARRILPNRKSKELNTWNQSAAGLKHRAMRGPKKSGFSTLSCWLSVRRQPNRSNELSGRKADLREAARKALQFDEAARQKSEHDAIRLTETSTVVQRRC